MSTGSGVKDLGDLGPGDLLFLEAQLTARRWPCQVPVSAGRSRVTG